MTETQQYLFDYLMSEQVRLLLPPKYYWHYTRVLELRENALLETLTDQQKALLESYQEAANDVTDLEHQALFRATWVMAHELLCP